MTLIIDMASGVRCADHPCGPETEDRTTAHTRQEFRIEAPALQVVEATTHAPLPTLPESLRHEDIADFLDRMS